MKNMQIKSVKSLIGTLHSGIIWATGMILGFLELADPILSS